VISEKVRDKIKLPLLTHSKSHTGFPMVLQSVTLN